jgi:hypothetical protein
LSDTFLSLAHALPTDVALGGALITLVQPQRGHAEAYNRWYEDDHFYAGATAGPFTLAGRRFVATRALRESRILGEGEDAAFRALAASGSYLALYWILAGHVDDNRRWAVEAMVNQLTPAGRGFEHRDHVYTSFHDARFAVVYDPAPMRPVHALDHPYAGVVLEVLELEDPDDSAGLDSGLAALAAVHRGDPAVGQCVAFTPLPALGALAHIRSDGFDLARSVCVLWFLHDDPREQWPGRFAGHSEALAGTALRSRLIAPFIPTVPGTNRYLDELESPP